MTAPAVDIGMPAHGRPVFLGEAIESVLAQTHSDLRVLVLDDPGGGEAEEVVRPYLSDPRVAYEPTGRPVSATDAMTSLIATGNAPYFAFLHDDDRWGPEFLERRVGFLERNRECALVFSGHVDIDPAGAVIARHPLEFDEGVMSRSSLFPEFCFRNLIDTMHSVVTRRTALEAVGPRLDPGFPRVFDWELWLRIAQHFPVGFVRGEDDVHYRVHEEQMSGRIGEADDFLRIFDRADAQLRDEAPELRASERRRRRHRASLLLSVALDRVQEEDRRGAFSALSEALRSSPRSAVHRRFAAAVAGLALGRAGRRALERARLAAYGRRRSAREQTA